MRSKCRWLILMIVIAACSKSKQELKNVAREAGVAGPQVAATIVTIHTTIQPANKTTISTIAIANDHARILEEVGEYRLFDLANNRVAFVNEFAKTFRYETAQSLRDRHDSAALLPINEKIAHATYSPTPARRDILGIPATESVVRFGGYQREMWFASHPSIPAQLFSLMLLSRRAGPDTPIVDRVDAALLATRGFPLAEHTELPYGNAKIIVDREVVSVARKNVSASIFAIPGDYREVQSPPAPKPRPRPVAPPVVEAPVSPPVPPPTQTAPPAQTATAPTATTETVSTQTTEAPKKVEAPKKTEPPKKQATAKKPATTKKAPATKKPATTKKPPTTKKPATTKKPVTAKKPPATKKTPPAKKPTTTKTTKKKES